MKRIAVATILTLAMLGTLPARAANASRCVAQPAPGTHGVKVFLASNEGSFGSVEISCSFQNTGSQVGVTSATPNPWRIYVDGVLTTSGNSATPSPGLFGAPIGSTIKVVVYSWCQQGVCGAAGHLDVGVGDA